MPTEPSAREQAFKMDERIAEAVRLTARNRKVAVADTVDSSPFPGKYVLLFDTSDLNPINVRGYNEVHFNLITALIERLNRKGHLDVSTGIYSPYKAQTKAYADWIHSAGRSSVSASSIDLKRPFLFFDTVEASGSENNRLPHCFTDDIRYGHRVTHNLQCALSGAETKLVVVMAVAYMQKHLTHGCYLHRFINHFRDVGEIHSAAELLADMAKENSLK